MHDDGLMHMRVWLCSLDVMELVQQLVLWNSWPWQSAAGVGLCLKCEAGALAGNWMKQHTPAFCGKVRDVTNRKT